MELYNLRRYFDDRNNIEVRIDNLNGNYQVYFSCEKLSEVIADGVFDYLIRAFVLDHTLEIGNDSDK